MTARGRGAIVTVVAKRHCSANSAFAGGVRPLQLAGQLLQPLAARAFERIPLLLEDLGRHPAHAPGRPRAH
jgi:hypothetical protein